MPHHAAMMASMGHGTSTSGVPWPSAAGAFVAMWTAMMVVMMLPSVWPTLRRYHRALDVTGVSRPGLRTMFAGTGYLGVWATIGLIVFALDAMVAAAAIQSSAFARVTPFAAGAVIVAAGALQCTHWKAHHLAHCRDVVRRGDAASMSTLSAWCDGVRLGVHCTMSCLGPMATLLVVGMMDVRAMAVVTAAITAERIVPAGAQFARATGAIALGAGILVLARAIGVA